MAERQTSGLGLRTIARACKEGINSANVSVSKTLDHKLLTLDDE